MVAMDGKDARLARAATISHPEAGGIKRGHGLAPALGEKLKRIHQTAVEVDTVDIEKLVLQRPDMDTRVVALGPHLLEKLIAGIVQELKLNLGAVELLELGVGLDGHVANRLAIEVPTAPHDHAVLIEEVQRLRRHEPQPAGAALGVAGEPHKALVGLAVLRQPALRIAAAIEVRPAVPDLAVEGEVLAAYAPLPKPKAHRDFFELGPRGSVTPCQQVG